jgi:Flp pilus assembly protein TadG
MAVVLPLLLMFVFGIIEFGRAIMVNQVLVNAAREACRRAVVPGATPTEVQNTASLYLSSAGISGYTYSAGVRNGSTLSALSGAKSQDSIEVTISVPYQNVAWGMFGWISSTRQLNARVLMRKE